MKETLEKLWNDYLLDECAAIDSEEERALLKHALEKYEAAHDLLTKEQCEAIEAYVDALSEIDSLFARKAFLKGCEFATSFLIEAGILKNGKACSS